MPALQKLSLTRECKTGYFVAAINRSASPASCFLTRLCFFSWRLAVRRSSFFCRLRGSVAIGYSFVGRVIGSVIVSESVPAPHSRELSNSCSPQRSAFSRAGKPRPLWEPGPVDPFGKPITLRHLLAHRSGLGGDPPAEGRARGSQPESR